MSANCSPLIGCTPSRRLITYALVSASRPPDRRQAPSSRRYSPDMSPPGVTCVLMSEVPHVGRSESARARRPSGHPRVKLEWSRRTRSFYALWRDQHGERGRCRLGRRTSATRAAGHRADVNDLPRSRAVTAVLQEVRAGGPVVKPALIKVDSAQGPTRATSTRA